MSNDKGKRGNGTRLSAIHGHQDSWLHYLHAKESKERQKIAYVAHEILDGTDYPKFKSDLSGLGKGRNWLRADGERKITPGKDWVEKMFQIIDDCSWFHQRMREKIKKGEHKGKYKVRYAQRNVKDRSKLSKTDKHSRPETDLLRETIDLRPDHSKVLEYLVQVGRKDDLIPILAEIQQHQIELFEEIYKGRKIVSEGEHVDSGQYHFDHWHIGIVETKVDDHGAVVEVVKKESGKTKAKDAKNGEKSVVNGKCETFRLRTPFAAHGVSDGMASFDRHRSALESDGRDAKQIMGFTHEKLLGNIGLVEEKNRKRLIKEGTPSKEIQSKDIIPRDIRMWREVDKFVDRKLRQLNSKLCDLARKEYADWLQHGYELEKLGIREESLQVTNHKRRKQELELLKAAVRALIDLVMMIPVVGAYLRENKECTISKKLNEIAEMVAPEKEKDLEQPGKPEQPSKGGSKGGAAKDDPSIDM